MSSTQVKQLEERASNGDSQACLDLYEEYQHGLHVSQDTTLASAWLEKALDFNNKDAQLIMGMNALQAGNLEEGLGYLNLSKNNGNPEAYSVLGQLYLGNVDGIHMDTDLDKGMELLVEAGLKGSTQAQILLGKCFYNGKWVTKDEGLARYWLQKASDSGDRTAQKLLDEVLLVRNVLN